MPLHKKVILLLGIVCVLAIALFLNLGRMGQESLEALPPAHAGVKDYERARWDPLHFKPAIDSARDEECLACHQEILKNTVRPASKAGVRAENSLAWYQTLDTYEGGQATFHWRHLKSAYSAQVMQMQCITCHQGSNPRDRAVNPPDANNTAHVLRKNVNPEICLMCHGKHANEIMGMDVSWPEIRDAMQNDCLICHSTIRTNRHQVNYLKPEAIEKLAMETGGDVCYGCHGGRQWYRLSFPYPRHPWEGMAPETPEWAKDRPAQSEARFLSGIANQLSGSQP